MVQPPALFVFITVLKMDRPMNPCSQNPAPRRRRFSMSRISIVYGTSVNSNCRDAIISKKLKIFFSFGKYLM